MVPRFAQAAQQIKTLSVSQTSSYIYKMYLKDIGYSQWCRSMGCKRTPQKFWFDENSGKTQKNSGTELSTFQKNIYEITLFGIECINQSD